MEWKTRPSADDREFRPALASQCLRPDRLAFLLLPCAALIPLQNELLVPVLHVRQRDCADLQLHPEQLLDELLCVAGAEGVAVVHLASVAVELDHGRVMTADDRHLVAADDDAHDVLLIEPTQHDSVEDLERIRLGAIAVPGRDERGLEVGHVPFRIEPPIDHVGHLVGCIE